MAEYRILHMYKDLMNLYGDWANADILARTLKACGHSATIESKSVGDDVSFEGYDIMYIGSGTERSQRACMQDLERHKEKLTEQVEAGLFVLATGNSHELFGLAVMTKDKERYNALGILDFETEQESTRVTGDCIYSASFLSQRLIGFINRAGSVQHGSNSVERPFTAEFEPSAGLCDNSHFEGIRYKNLLGTYLTGPILVRNPYLLAYFTDTLTASDSGISRSAMMESALFKRQEAAYQTALNELLLRK